MSQKSYMWNKGNAVTYRDPSGYDAYAPTTEIAVTDVPTSTGASEEPDDGEQTTSGSGNANHANEPLKTIASVISCTSPGLPPCGDWTKGEIQTVRNASSYIAALDTLDRFVVSGALLGGIFGLGSRITVASSPLRIGTPIYRLFGGASQYGGAYWALDNPATIPDYASLAGLPAGNAGQYLATGVIVDSTNVFPSIAPPLLQGQSGGLTQILLDSGQAWVTSVTMP